MSAELLEIHPGRLLLFATWYDRSDSQRPLFNPVTAGILPSRQLKAVSDDEGDTWTPWEDVSIAGLTGCASTGPILQWSDGSIAYPFESFKEYDDPTPIPHRAWVLPSIDGGRTFGKPAQIASSQLGRIQFWDQRLGSGQRPGEFIGMFWTHDAESKHDLPVHAFRGNLLDGTIRDVSTWKTPIVGQIGAPLLLPDGRWLALVVDRRQRAKLTLWISPDDGNSWPIDQSLDVYHHEERAPVTQGVSNVDLNKLWEDFGKWSFGQPTLRAMDSHRVLLAFYAGTPDRMSVHWVRVCIDRR